MARSSLGRAAVLGSAAVTVAFALSLWVAPASPVARLLDYVGLVAAPALAAVTCALTARRAGHRGGPRRAWWFLAAFAALWSVGEVIWTYYELVLHREVPFPSLADVGYLGAVPCAVAGMLAFRTPRHERAHGWLAWNDLIDGVVVGGSVLFISWATVLEATYHATSPDLLTRLIGLAYPVSDVVLLSMAVLLATRAGGRARHTLGLVAASLVAFTIADWGFAYLTASASYTTGAMIDTGWLGGFLFLAAAAVQPDAAHVRDRGQTEHLLRVAIPTAFVLAVCLVGTAEVLATGSMDAFLALDAAVIGAFLAIRQFLTFRDKMLLARSLETQVDARTAQLAERQARLAESEASFRLLFEANPQPMWVHDARTSRFLEVNQAAMEHYGFSRAEFLGAGVADIEIADGLGGARRHRRRDGSVIEVVVATHELEFAGRPAVLVAIQDVTERNRLEQQLWQQAFSDALTGLANRALFDDRLDHALARAARSRRSVAVLLLDLDHFKNVNDSLGHAAGDDVLVEVAKRLREALRDGDTIARLGGDEFAVLCEDLSQHETIEVAERLREAVSMPVVVGDRILALTTSVGVAVVDRGETASRDVLRDADAAMYQAKHGGRDRCAVFDDALRRSALDRLELATGLRLAIERDELRLVYQPIVDIANGSPVGVEALVRWHRQQGACPPAEFIPLAEETGFILSLGRWVLAEACREVASWPNELTLSVNLSVRQLAEPNLPEDVQRVLELTGLEPSRLKLEITESVFVDGDDVIDAIVALKALGVRISVDDFGTGYSSLLYLRRLPIDELKIDRSFVAGIVRHHEDAAIVSSVIDLAHTLGLRVVAEGVEEDAELEVLRRLGCELGQGYLWARPMTPLDMLTWLDHREDWSGWRDLNPRPLRPERSALPS